MKSKAVFFDRDGIINKRLIGDYVKSPDEFILIEDILPIVDFAHNKSYLNIVITNQQGIGKKIMTVADLLNVHNYMHKLMVDRIGKTFDEIYYCPDLANSNSKRRKPEPGMLIEAIENWNIDPVQSWMIGDSISDIIAGKKAGVNTILLGHFNEEDAQLADYNFTFLTQVYNFLVNVL